MLKITKAFLVVIATIGLSSASVAETIHVNTAADSGPGSLRQAIISANANPSLTEIWINIPTAPSSEVIINVPTALPAFTAPVQVRYVGDISTRVVLKAPVIVGPGAPFPGFSFEPGSANSLVTSITFRNFIFAISLNTGGITIQYNRFENNQGGIDIRPVGSTGGNLIKGNYFSSSHSGAYAFAGISSGNTLVGNGFNGIGISLSGGGNIIGGYGSSDANTFNNAPGNAITLENGSGARIIHNTINGSAAIGIKVAGTDIEVVHNNLSNNIGYDIEVSGGHSNRIGYNQITGDNHIFNGIYAHDGLSYNIYGNGVSGGSIEVSYLTSSSWYGPLSITDNQIVNDPQGVSGHGGLTLFNVTNARIRGNVIHHNASNGIYLGSNSTNNLLIGNVIYENFRTGIYVGNNLYNKISQNWINSNYGSASNGKTGISTTPKAAPSILTAKRVGANFVLTGNGTVTNDSIEVFISDRASRNSNLIQNALTYKATVKSNGTTWTATFSAANLNSAEVYFIATSTDLNATTSTFSKAVGVELNGPTAATTNHTSTYFAEYIPGASYSFWSTLPYSSYTQSGNQVSFNFNQVGAGTVSVGYTDPTTGAWKQYNLAVTVFGPARSGAAEDEEATSTTVNSLAFPNPFVSATQVTVEGTESISLQVFDDKGSLVHSTEGLQHGQTVELGNNLNPGVYVLKTVSGGNVKTSRLVKAN